MAYAVEQRTVEFGIRMALGAEGGSLRNMVLGEAMKLAIVGAVIGSVAAYFLTSVMSAMLFGVSSKDPLVFVGAALLLMGVTFLASYLPARRVVGIDPVIALRHQ